MTNKEKYIDNLRSQYADEPNEFLELCWLLHDYDKAKAYADLLCACTSYAEIAQQVVCRMYVSGDIDETRARSEKFLSLLIPLACLETGGNSHAAVYHVRQMLDDPNVRKARKNFEEKRLKAWRATQEETAGQSFPSSCKITIEIADVDSMRMFIDFLKFADVRFRVEDAQQGLGVIPVAPLKERVIVEETPQWLHEVFSDLYAYCPDADNWSYDFQSDGTSCSDTTLTEVLELISQELL